MRILRFRLVVVIPNKLYWTPRDGVGTGDGSNGDRLVDFASNL
jgi:hypothetical protein